jgi:hypothetical protein
LSATTQREKLIFRSVRARFPEGLDSLMEVYKPGRFTPGGENCLSCPEAIRVAVALGSGLGRMTCPFHERGKVSAAMVVASTGPISGASGGLGCGFPEYSFFRELTEVFCFSHLGPRGWFLDSVRDALS